MFAVIMAGGSGTRFWPASREHLPKQFLKITSDRTMLEETVARMQGVTPLHRVYTVVGRVHAEITRQILAGTEVATLIEPRGRNTAPCIGLAALHIKRFSEDAPIVVTPADHFIADGAKFTETIRAAAEVARSESIVTIGIQPTRPETGYGYIEAAQESGRSLDQPYFAVERFVEKPNYETALGYVAKGNFWWNSGIFIFTARTILAEIEKLLPELHEGLKQIELAIDTPEYGAVVERVYAQVPAISIDYGVMEKTALPIYVLKADFGWSDVGSWQALYELRSQEQDARGNLLLSETMIAGAERNLVYSTTGRKIALLGVEGLVVVDTPDALMVADLNRSQEVKVFPELLKKREPARS